MLRCPKRPFPRVARGPWLKTPSRNNRYRRCMSTLATVSRTPSPRPSTLEAARLNGDLPMTGAQRREYLAFHARRNEGNSHASREAGVKVRYFPGPSVPVSTMASPSRLAMHAFFDWALREASAGMARRDVRALDLGCGNGVVTIDHLIDAGFRGQYIGVDVARHPKWSDAPLGVFSRSLVLGQAEDADVARVLGKGNRLDFLISSTALEHIEDAAGAIRRFESFLAPDAWQVHFVPGTRALALYGTHGWRQFSPRCLKELFPRGEIYAFGGPASDWWHKYFITSEGNPHAPNRRGRFNKYYRIGRSIAWHLDGVLADVGLFDVHDATMYGVVVRPGDAG